MNGDSGGNELVARLVERLSNPANAEPCAAFPRDPAAAAHPGLYGWWCDPDGLGQLQEAFVTELHPLIYAGQAGATTADGAARSATLRSRIGGNHLNGNIGSSTFRKTLTALLRPSLGLRLAAPGKLDVHSNAEISRWMREHLMVVIAPCPYRAALAGLEALVLDALDPPLNLQGMPPSPIRAQLRHLRSHIGRNNMNNPSFDASPQRANTTPAPTARPAPKNGRSHTAFGSNSAPSQRVTSADILAGRIRVPSRAKHLFPSDKCGLAINLRGERFNATWNPRMGPDRERSGVIGIPGHAIGRIVPADAVLTISRTGESIDLR